MRVAPGGRPLAQTRAFYNRISGLYDALAAGSERAVWREAVRLLAPQPGERILDVGAGTGGCLIALSEGTSPGGYAVGLDLSDGMLAVAGEKARSCADLRLGLVQADAHQLPFRTGLFDAGVLVFTLELFDTRGIARVLAECRRVLRPGGRLAVASLSKDSTHGTLVRAGEWLHSIMPGWVDCRPIYATEAIEAAGYSVICHEQPRWWVPVEIVMAAAPGRSKGGSPRG